MLMKTWCAVASHHHRFVHVGLNSQRYVTRVSIMHPRAPLDDLPRRVYEYIMFLR